jgi:hypothetical protein
VHTPACQHERQVPGKTIEKARTCRVSYTTLDVYRDALAATKLADISYESVGLLQKLALRYLGDQLGISGGAPDGQEIVVSDESGRKLPSLPTSVDRSTTTGSVRMGP